MTYNLDKSKANLRTWKMKKKPGILSQSSKNDSHAVRVHKKSSLPELRGEFHAQNKNHIYMYMSSSKEELLLSPCHPSAIKTSKFGSISQ